MNWLLIDDDLTFCRILQTSIERLGHTATYMTHLEQLPECLQHNQYQRIVVDMMLGDISAIHILPTIRTAQPDANIVVLTGYASIPTTVQAIKAGADNYLSKPAGIKEILAAFTQPMTAAPNTEEASTYSVKRLEWEHIQRILDENQGNISATARQLGMHRRTLQRKLAKKPAT